MNRLFVEYLKRYTYYDFELIIIDNGSTDESQQFFKNQGYTVIQNEGNYMYPHCQNQGIRIAKFDHLVFLNNDVLVSSEWDRKALQIMDRCQLEIASCCTTDSLESMKATHQFLKRWKYIRNPLAFLFGYPVSNLRLMHYLLFGDWDKWTSQRYSDFGEEIKEGFSGSNIIMRRSALEKVGLWDEKIQSADFDLFLRTKSRSLAVGDVKPIHLLLGVFLHHYVRLTLRKGHPHFLDGHLRTTIEEKWGKVTANALLQQAGVEI